MANAALTKAKKEKNDEFYTKYEDIENELKYYKEYLNGKKVYCNADDYEKSNFFKYFFDNFENLKLKRLICTSYKKEGKGKFATYDGCSLVTGELNGDGDFSSDECLEFLRQADVIITNPPFSIAKKYMTTLLENDKNFLVIGNLFWFGCWPEFFRKYFLKNRIFVGRSKIGSYYFKSAYSEDETKISNVVWYTNIRNGKSDILHLTKQSKELSLNHYDNIDAINIDKSKDIPFDYEGVIGVPVSILRYLDNDGFIRTDKGKYKIVGSSKNCFTSTKTYLNPKAYRNGIEKKGCQHIQTNGCLQVNEPPKDKCYYKADNSLYLVAPFMRILIIKT